ncbi:hypothetical protein [Paenibacillus roseipurpureus]|uniref:Uncharacterized protein n=1 Tax=Paenibacillus roseopurpureus TaxID=2918901 RepID=A0AA96LKX6_9BACL|nr:hypothetical protein [Paenibacillus sp. MBLB1832]WNR43002.1 hypothetical protein MJB10_18010 [Paenibacillus sp. MBLB1832]
MSIEEVKNFIADGSYARLKHEEEKLKLLKSFIRNEQDMLNKKRMMWREHGVIGEFITNKDYDYNHLELNELLYDLGILPFISQLDRNLLSAEELKLLKPIQICGEKYIRYSPNKFGKLNGFNQIAFSENIIKLPLSNKVGLWRKSFLEAEFLKRAWDKKRKLAVKSCGSYSSIAFEMGTLSFIEAPACYMTKEAVEFLTKETLLKCATVDLQSIVEFTSKGILKVSDLNKTRKTTDIQRKYYLITLEKEIRKRMFWQSRLERMSKLNIVE